MALCAASRRTRRFLKVLDAHDPGFADYTGNRQYISTGNIAGDKPRQSVFSWTGHPNQTRLKILGRTEVVTEESNLICSSSCRIRHLSRTRESGEW